MPRPAWRAVPMIDGESTGGIAANVAGIQGMHDATMARPRGPACAVRAPLAGAAAIPAGCVSPSSPFPSVAHRHRGRGLRRLSRPVPADRGPDPRRHRCQRHPGHHGEPEAHRLPERQPALRGHGQRRPLQDVRKPNFVELKDMRARIVTDDQGGVGPARGRSGILDTAERADEPAPGRRVCTDTGQEVSSAPPSSTSRPAPWSRTSPSP